MLDSLFWGAVSFRLAKNHISYQSISFIFLEFNVPFRTFLHISPLGWLLVKVLVNSIPMTGLLTGIARYLRNLYGAMEQMESSDLYYFNGKQSSAFMPSLARSHQRQQTIKALRQLPDPLLFGIRAGRWMKYEHGLNTLCRQTKKAPFDIYHETAFTPAKLTRIPTIFSVYDLSLVKYRETHPKERVWLFEYFIKTRLQYAKHILTISEFIRREIIETFHVAPSMVTSIPLAPDPVFTPCSETHLHEVLSRYQLPTSYLLFVSSLEPRKNIDLLIEALESANTDIPLVLAGWQGWGDKQWLEKIKGVRFKNRIYFTGHVPDHDLQAIYTGAAALIYPSLYEGFGLPIVEAMACGCPVICSNTASMPEIAGDAAILVDPLRSDELAHAIESIVQDCRLRDTLISNGVKQAGQFTWKRTARETLDLFKRVA